jgi:exopolyphosphatase / guanosine-5'-triphosphate,3'-diphosphate pyrophosphatase
MKRCSIIDLGSNTFHILIVDVEDNKFVEVYRERVFTRLGEGGIDTLTSGAIQRGLNTAVHFGKLLKEYSADNVIITGTAALRTAQNANEFVVPAEIAFGHPIQLIDGNKEAELIFKGVKLLSPMVERSVIMDIGGGSTEFIIVEDGELLWAQSYKLGVGVLHALFHHDEPIKKQDVMSCKAHIRSTIAPFLDQIKDAPIHTLIGASGSFEVFESMTGRPTYDDQVNDISLPEARTIIDKVIAANIEERARLKGLPPERVKLIVVAMILIDVVIEVVNPVRLQVTPYALKEGLLAEII